MAKEKDYDYDIPSYEWAKGHSGVMLSDEAEKLVELLDEE